MRIVVHDFSGHPFQVQLSRELARRGHTVAHWHCSSFTTGKGRLALHEGDPKTLSIVGIPMGSTFARYSPRTRVRQEVAYGRELGRRLTVLGPDVVLFCNTPLIAHAIAARACARAGIRMVFWLQDVYSAAITATAAEHLGATGRLIGRLADRLERRIARRSRAIVAISDEFLSTLDRWGVRSWTTVIPNWAPLPEVPVLPSDNEWSRAHDLSGRPVVLYSGTLGFKHNPAILLATARAMNQRLPEGRVVVVSEGRGRDWLAEEKRREGVDNLVLLDYQPYDTLPEVLASADVLVAILEPAAGRYSVPSKILSYLCAGRAILAVIPTDNAAALILRSSGAGIVVQPGEHEGAVATVFELLGDEQRRSQMASDARKYAEKTFSVTAIADRFEPILAAAAASL